MSPHPALAAIHLRHREDHVRGRLDGALHQATRGVRVFFDHGIGQLVEVADASLHHAVDGLDGFLACDLAGCMTTHAIAHDVQTKPVIEEVRVFVRLPLPTYVGQSGADSPKRCTHCWTRL